MIGTGCYTKQNKQSQKGQNKSVQVSWSQVLMQNKARKRLGIKPVIVITKQQMLPKFLK